MLGRKKSFPKPQLVHFAELCSKNEVLCLMWRAEVGTSAEGFKVNPGPWPAPAPASPGSLQFPPAAIPGCCQAPSWPPSGHLAPIPGRRRRRPRSICTNSRSTAQRPLCYLRYFPTQHFPAALGTIACKPLKCVQGNVRMQK